MDGGYNGEGNDDDEDEIHQRPFGCQVKETDRARGGTWRVDFRLGLKFRQVQTE